MRSEQYGSRQQFAGGGQWFDGNWRGRDSNRYQLDGGRHRQQ
nr:hypothetical protein [Burkholderia anthina]